MERVSYEEVLFVFVGGGGVVELGRGGRVGGGGGVSPNINYDYGLVPHTCLYKHPHFPTFNQSNMNQSRHKSLYFPEPFYIQYTSSTRPSHRVEVT